jgi:hypothetical protein
VQRRKKEEERKKSVIFAAHQTNARQVSLGDEQKGKRNLSLPEGMGTQTRNGN